jgi:hypothetical protein
MEQKIMYFNTYLLGICDTTSFIFFPKTDCIIQNKNILKNDILHNYNIIDEEFDKIISTIIKLNKKCKKDMKNEILNLKIKKLNLNVIFLKEHVEIKIHNEVFKVSLKDYTRLKKLFIKKDDLDWYIAILLTRYKYYGYVKEGISLSADNVYKFIKMNNYEDCTLEAFAGTFNSNLKNYCSLFYDIEKYFGSKGSFFKLKVDNTYKIIVYNPPYLTSVMDKASGILLDYLNTCEILIIGIIPDWRSISEYENDKSQYKINEIEQTRQNVPYYSYSKLRLSKYFKYVFSIGNYKYYNFYSENYKTIRDNTLIFVASSRKDNIDDKFKNYLFLL